MGGILKLDGKAKCLVVDVGGRKHEIPLADYMPMPDAREMLRIRRMPAKERDGAYTEFFIGYFERAIGEDEFASLTMADFEKIMDAWNDASDAEGSATPGE